MDQDNQNTFGLMPITAAEFEQMQKLIYLHFGIRLTDQKKTLVVGRLQKLVHTLGLSTFSEYIAYVERDKSGRALSDLVNRISTNHTFFYREKDHFEFFTDTLLPNLAAQLGKKSQNDIRIWSAGCSSGEEPYTLVMLMKEHFGSSYDRYDAGILATDISDRVLSIAKTGVYDPDRIDALPAPLRQRYFHKTTDNQWAVVDEIKNEVTFRHLNLMNEHFPFKKQFHAIFCRNVMIYFDDVGREGLVQRFYDSTLTGGYLFIGHSESLQRGKCPYNYVRPAVYQKRGTG